MPRPLEFTHAEPTVRRIYSQLPAAQALAKKSKAKPSKSSNLVVRTDGTVELPAESVPMSKFLSPEGKQYLNQHLHDMLNPKVPVQDKGVPRFMMPYLQRQKALFALKLEDEKMADVHVYVYTPSDGIRRH